MIQLSEPMVQDLVLGGQTSPPTDAAVLGGIVGLEQRFMQMDVNHKLLALTEAADCGDSGVELLELGLQDFNLPVRVLAYTQLKKLSQSPVEGIPLLTGDEIYGVYRAAITYGDDFYYIHADINADYLEQFPLYRQELGRTGQRWRCISDLPEENQMSGEAADYNPNLISYQVDSATAQKQAWLAFVDAFQQLHHQIGFDGYPLDIGMIAAGYTPNSIQDFDLEIWARENCTQLDIDQPGDFDQPEEYQFNLRQHVIQELYTQQKFELLAQIWTRLGYEPLGFTHRFVIDRPCYLRLQAIEAVTQ